MRNPNADKARRQAGEAVKTEMDQASYRRSVQPMYWIVRKWDNKRTTETHTMDEFVAKVPSDIRHLYQLHPA